MADPRGDGPPARRRAAARRGRWVRFVQRYGWRAYALPLLSVLTVAVLVRGTPGDASSLSGTDASGRGSRAGGSATRSGSGVHIEGLTNADAGFAAGSTPAAVMIHLGDDATSCSTNSYRRLVLVSISRQHLWACDRGKQVNSTPVTTGSTVGHNQTPLGSWRVQARERDRYLVGPGYRDYVHYWVPFNGDFGLHDASWQTMPFGSKDYRRHGSHGCVHLPTATMAWLYEWAHVGSTVVTVES